MLAEKIIIATRNDAKIDYYRDTFNGVVSQVIGLKEAGIEGKPEETGNTAEENAEAKAGFYSGKTELPVFCEDESLFADFLPPEKQPGTHVRRINGRDKAEDQVLFDYWEGIIKHVPKKKRTGHWHVAYSVGLKGRVKTVSRDFPVLFFYPASKIRIPGWPMSSLEGAVKFGKPNSEWTEEEKSQAIAGQRQLIIEQLEKLLK